jgi:hypothetical protein
MVLLYGNIQQGTNPKRIILKITSNWFTFLRIREVGLLWEPW